MMFSLRVKMTSSIQTHFYNDKAFATNLWRFPEEGCIELDTIPHVMRCPQYCELPDNMNLKNEKRLGSILSTCYK